MNAVNISGAEADGLEPTQPVVLQIGEHAVTVRLNRPDKRNALTVEMVAAIRDVLRTNESRRLPLIIRSNTPGMFISGSDVEEIRRRAVGETLTRSTAVLCTEIERYPSPTIAVVEGFALGGGCEVALACDFRISAREAVWGFPEVRLGIIPGAGGLTRLPALVGWGNAIDLVLTGRPIDAETASNMGLVQRVVRSTELEEELESLLKDLSKAAPLAQRLAKEAMRVSGDMYRLVDATAQAVCIASEDAQDRLANVGGGDGKTGS